jgi:hypothetical protein
MEESWSGAGSGDGFIQINCHPDADPGGPKTVESYGSRSGKLVKNKLKHAATMHTESTCRPVAWITGPCPPFKMSVCIDACDLTTAPLLSWRQGGLRESILRSSVAATVHRFFGQVGLKFGREGKILSLFECTLTKKEFPLFRTCILKDKVGSNAIAGGY